MITATTAEVKSNFGMYLGMAEKGNVVIITDNGKEVARLVPSRRERTFITDSLTGILAGDYDSKTVSAEKHAKHSA